MRQILCTFVMVFFLLIPTLVFAHNHVDKDKWNELNQTSDKVLQLVKQEKYEDAKQLLDYFSQQFLKITQENPSLSMTELRVITTSYDRAVVAVTSVNMPVDERIKKVTELRLVIDAVSAEYKPLWLNSKKLILNNLSELSSSSEKKDAQAFEHRLNQFLRHYSMIRPALLISIDQIQFQRIESQIQFLERNRNELIGGQKLNEHLNLMVEEFEKLFNQVQEDQADPSLLWVMFTIGSMIFVSLSYVGYKKYRADKRKQQLRQRVGKK